MEITYFDKFTINSESGVRGVFMDVNKNVMEEAKMSNKTVISQKQHFALETLKAKGMTIGGIVYDAMRCNLMPINDVDSVYELPLDTLIRALYTPEDVIIEQTLEEQMLSIYGKHGDWHKKGMRDVLDIIGMKVKGINE